MDTFSGYDQWAPDYDAFDNPMVAMTNFALALAPLAVAGRRVVELGCGTGRLAPRLLTAGALSYCGIDGSAGMLRQAQARQLDTRVRWVQADLAAGSGLPEKSFDLALLALVLEHAERVEPMLREASRLLAAGGELRALEIHPELQKRGVAAHYHHQGRKVALPSYPHDTAEFRDAAVAAGLELRWATDLYATPETLNRSPKLIKHLGRPVLLDVGMHKPAASARLLYTPLTPADAETFHALVTDEHVRRYLMDGKVMPRAFCEAQIGSSQALFARGDRGLWLLRRREDGVAIGFGGYLVLPDVAEEPQLVYAVTGLYAGRGYGSEAAAWLVEAAAGDILASVDAVNVASVRILEKLGFARIEVRTGAFGPMYILRRNRVLP